MSTNTYRMALTVHLYSLVLTVIDYQIEGLLRTVKGLPLIILIILYLLLLLSLYYYYYYYYYSYCYYYYYYYYYLNKKTILI